LTISTVGTVPSVATAVNSFGSMVPGLRSGATVKAEV